MKQLVHKKWLSIPVTVFLVLVLTAGAVVAATLVGPVTQTITQTIEGVDYGSITVEPTAISLDSIKVNEMFSELGIGTVTVVVGVDADPCWLHIKLDEASVSPYAMYTVGLMTEVDHPMSPEVLSFSAHKGLAAPDVFDESIQLTESGTYIFSETIVVKAGPDAGLAEVLVTFTLEDTE